MTPGLPLNTIHTHNWAAVVSSTAWKRHTLAPNSALTAEYARSPLILWATRPSETEAVALALPSVLEDQIDRLNTAQVFERFKWAARGRQTITRGARAGKRVGMLALWRGLSPKVRIRTLRRALSPAKIYSDVERMAVLKAEFAGFWDQESPDENLPIFTFYIHGEKHTYTPTCIHSMLRFSVRGHTKFLITFGSKNLSNPKGNFKLFLKHLEREAYRAHLTRRVKPAPRRHRIRRPLYARPRPPSAPLAPPVI